MLLTQQKSSMANFHRFITSEFFHAQEHVLYQLKPYLISLHFMHNKCHIGFGMLVALEILLAYNMHSFNFKSFVQVYRLHHLIINVDLQTTMMVVLSLPIGLVTVHMYVPLSLVVTLSME